MQDIEKIKSELLAKMQTSTTPREILKDTSLKTLFNQIKTLPVESRKDFGQKINELRQVLESAIATREEQLDEKTIQPIDITAPWDINASSPQLLPTEFGSNHPITTEIKNVVDIFTRMGFEAIESRQIDDDENMFTALNFPENHPARDSYDTFRTEEGFIPPAHTSTMQHRILQEGKEKLESGGQIATISYGRVFRNEDVDATHEHTFYQCEGIFVSQDASLSQMLGTLRSFFESYYSQKLKIKTQPSYFPFTEPSLEFLIEKPVALGGKEGEWLEVLGCGMIHPNVLANAGIDATKYRGFAWGGGIERLIMLKYGIEDLRYFESGKLQFLRKFI